MDDGFHFPGFRKFDVVIPDLDIPVCVVSFIGIPADAFLFKDRIVVLTAEEAGKSIVQRKDRICQCELVRDAQPRVSILQFLVTVVVAFGF